MGTPNVGWDTDQFPTDLYLTTHTMLVLMKMGGFTTGGLNFEAKRRRESYEPVDLVHAHVVGMDAFARGLKTAAAIRADGRIGEFIKQRYATWDSGVGADVEAGKTTLADLEKYALANPEPMVASGRQEMIEGLINEFI
jgi:xylose isomerase